MFWEYAILWLGLAVLGILNGAVRNYVYRNALGELRAHQVSTFTLIVLMGVYTWAFGFLWPLESAAQALEIGLMWLGMTVAFEFLFGHFVMKNPWPKLLFDYNISKGRIWLLVLVWTALAPLAVYALG